MHTAKAGLFRETWFPGTFLLWKKGGIPVSDTVQNSLYHPETPKKKRWLYILVGVLFLIALTVLVLFLLPKEDPQEEKEPKREKIAAVIGTHELGIAEANYFYIDYIRQTYDQWFTAYGDSTPTYVQLLLGLDLSKPLDQQFYNADESLSWAEYMAGEAMGEAAAAYALYDAAKAEGFSLPEEARQAVDEEIATYELYAQIMGYRDLRGYLQALYTPSSGEDSFRSYLLLRATAEAFYKSKEESLHYDDAALRAFEADKYHQFSSFSYCEYFISTARFLSGGTADENGHVTYSYEEIKAAETQAQELAGKIARKEPDTQEALDKVIEALDPGQGLSVSHRDIPYTQIPEGLVDWLCYEGRGEGDITLIAQPMLVLDGSGDAPGCRIILFQGRNENTMPLVSVRHILFGFEGGTTDSNGLTTYSDAEKQAALNRATRVLELYNAGEHTEAAFAALAAEYSEDTVSAEHGGLYTDVYPGQMVMNFNDWCFDEQRRIGDVDILETQYGYHIMYYCGPGMVTYRDYMLTEALIRQDMDSWYEGITAGVSVTDTDMERFRTDYVIMP